MPKTHLTISTSTELLRFETSKIVYILADGNYSEVYQVDKNKTVLVSQLGKVAEEIDNQLGKKESGFVRVGKSYIINRKYIYRISFKANKQELILSDMATFSYTLTPSQEALKKLKEYVLKREKEVEEKR